MLVVRQSTPAVSPSRIWIPRTSRELVIAAGALAALVAIVFYGWHWWTEGRFIESTDDAYVGGEVTVIAPKVAGFIGRVAVIDNQIVHSGDLLVALDDRDFRATLAHAEAAVAEQEANLFNLAATRNLQLTLISQARAEVSGAAAESDRARADQTRLRDLSQKAAASIQSFERADAVAKQAAAIKQKADEAVLSAQRALTVIDTRRAQIEAALAAAQAELRIAELNLSYTQLRSPIDGTVGNRSARLGAYATVGAQLLSIVPARGLWVDANFKEDQLAQMRAGAPVTIRADMLPGVRLHGQVASLAPATGAQFSVLPAENATGNFTKIVQRVPVRINLDARAPEVALLRPGLSVTAAVNVHQAHELVP